MLDRKLSRDNIFKDVKFRATTSMWLCIGWSRNYESS
jgi:hypothetical protein